MGVGWSSYGDANNSTMFDSGGDWRRAIADGDSSIPDLACGALVRAHTGKCDRGRGGREEVVTGA